MLNTALLVSSGDNEPDLSTHVLARDCTVTTLMAFPSHFEDTLKASLDFLA